MSRINPSIDRLVGSAFNYSLGLVDWYWLNKKLNLINKYVINELKIYSVNKNIKNNNYLNGIKINFNKF